MEKRSKDPATRIEIPWQTIFKILLAVLLAFVTIKLWPLCKLVVVSILLAVPLYRLVLWACRKGWPRWLGLLFSSLAFVLALAGLVALVSPMVVNQMSGLGQNLPKLKQQVLEHVPAGPFRNLVEQATSLGNVADVQKLSQKALVAVQAALGGLLDVVLVIALTIYLMVDGPRALQWLVACFPAGQRRKVTKGLENISSRVVAYIIGQSIVSGLFAGYVLLVLSVLHVPMALLLALLAGVLDIVPVLGISISLVLGTLMAMTVSSTSALIVTGLYGAYHILENYLIIPKVYGDKLRLSGLAVLLSMMAGGLTAGLVGAVAVLPLVAAYPALEALWLADELEPEVVKDHQEQLRGR